MLKRTPTPSNAVDGSEDDDINVLKPGSLLHDEKRSILDQLAACDGNSKAPIDDFDEEENEANEVVDYDDSDDDIPLSKFNASH